MKFELYTTENAPQAARPDLETIVDRYGFLPNLYAVFAESPAAVKTYKAISEALEHAALSPLEQQVVFIAVSGENGCTYCVAAHSFLANMCGMSETLLKELRDKQPLSDPKLNALRTFALSVMDNRGWVPEQALQAFVEAGYTKQHVLDVLTVLAQKTLSNYTNHLANTPLDEQFSAYAWDKR